jgi:hypothetical protein
VSYLIVDSAFSLFLAFVVHMSCDLHWNPLHFFVYRFFVIITNDMLLFMWLSYLHCCAGRWNS